MNIVTRFKRQGITLVRPLSALLLVASLSGCAVFKSAYITEREVAVCGAAEPSSRTCCAIPPDDARGPGNIAATCTARSFERALRDHAHFSNALGEVLIPLASLVAYKGFSGGNEHNIAALASGGAAMYGIGTYIYKKPREAIYITGLSGIACAVRLTDLRTLDDPDRSYLLGATGGMDQGLDADYRHGVAAAQTRDAAISLASAAQETLVAALATSVVARSGCSTTQIDTFEAARKEALTRVQLRAGDIAELRQRLARVDINARRLLKADRNAQRDLLRAAEQIRIDVNHMLAAQTPDPASLRETLAVLKMPTAAVDPAASGEQDPVDPAADTVAAINANRNAADGLKIRLAARSSMQAVCDLPTESSRIKQQEQSLGDSIAAAKQALEAMEQRIAMLAPSEEQQTPIHQECAVNDVAVPQPFRLAGGGNVQLPQGGSSRVALVGGKAPFHSALGRDPSAGTLSAKILGDATLGRVLEIKASAEVPTGDYNILLWDGASGQQTVKATVTPKAGG